MPENYVFQYVLKYGIGYWNCLFSEYNSRRIYKIIHVHMLSRSITNFNVSFLTKKTHVFTSECDNLRLAQSLEFNPQFLSLK